MNGTRDPSETAADDEGDGLDPREAAMLLDQTRRRARRQFDLRPPLLSVVNAAVILVAYGALWLSVRDQQPYQGPSLAAIAAVYAAVVVVIAVGARVVHRATAGVSGRSQRQLRADGAAVVAAYIATALLQGALRYEGASNAIVYGVFPAAAPLIIVGGTVAGAAGAREDWTLFGAALAVVVVGLAAAFAGPAGAWAVAGAGLFIVVVGYAAATAWLRRT
jgi:hypothetical protein